MVNKKLKTARGEPIFLTKKSAQEFINKQNIFKRRSLQVAIFERFDKIGKKRKIVVKGFIAIKKKRFT